MRPLLIVHWAIEISLVIDAYIVFIVLSQLLITNFLCLNLIHARNKETLKKFLCVR